MSQFVEKVHRVEPTWFCVNCKQHQSIGNVVRHKAICNPEQNEESSDSDVEEIEHDYDKRTNSGRQQDNSLIKKRNIPKRSCKNDNSNETDDGDNSQENSQIILTQQEPEISANQITDQMNLIPIKLVRIIFK